MFTSLSRQTLCYKRNADINAHYKLSQVWFELFGHVQH